jgi:hypothetical protein
MRSLAALSISLVLAPGAAIARPAPQILIDYTPVFDRVCSQAVGSPTPQGASEEIVARLDEFRRSWAQAGPRLLETAQAITGQPYGFREAVAAAHVCPGFASMSLPLLINVRLFLRATNGRFVGRPEMFVDTLFHETLHTYIRGILGGGDKAASRSALLRKYAQEPLVTRNHLHLIALQSEVYRRIGQPEMVDAARAADVPIGPEYARAWKIVDTEGARPFIEELRPSARGADAARPQR